MCTHTHTHTHAHWCTGIQQSPANYIHMTGCLACARTILVVWVGHHLLQWSLTDKTWLVPSVWCVAVCPALGRVRVPPLLGMESVDWLSLLTWQYLMCVGCITAYSLFTIFKYKLERGQSGQRPLTMHLYNGHHIPVVQAVSPVMRNKKIPMTGQKIGWFY